MIGLSVHALRDRIEHIGVRFVPFSGTADLDLRDFAAAYPEFRTMPPGVEMTRFYLERVFADPLIDQNKGMREAIEEFAPDVIIVDNLFLGALPLLLGPRANRPPIISVGSTYVLWHRTDSAPCNLGFATCCEKHLFRYCPRGGCRMHGAIWRIHQLSPDGRWFPGVATEHF